MNDTIEVGARKQLFIDDCFLARQYGMQLTVNPPLKAERVLWPETPWESTSMGIYSTFLEDEGICKLWYDAYVPQVSEELPRSLCYATSEDGIHWQRKNVNLFDWLGHKENNIVLPGICGSVMIDPQAPEQERFKAVCKVFENTLWPDSKGAGWHENLGSIHVFTSADGIHWTQIKPAASPWFHDSQNFIFYDDRLGKYVGYVRTAERRTGGLGPRTQGRVELDDPLQTPWPYRDVPPGVVITKHLKNNIVYHGQFDTALSCDESDPPDSDLQMCPIVKYPWAQDVYLGLFTLYRHYPWPPEGEYSNDGPNSVQLVVSRDGINWQRPERKPYIPLGLVGEHDGGVIWPSLGMIRSGNEIWQYYCGSRGTHGRKRERCDGGLRRIVQRLDGFVSADAAYTGGEFTTPLLRFSGAQLELNVDCAAEGQVWVEILDEGERPIEGYKLSEAISVDRNQIAAVVRWKERENVGELSGRPVRLHVKARACKLYAFQFGAGGE